jgi:beta-carotene ketolase (CrtO type)
MNGFVAHRLNRPGGWAAGAAEAEERIWATVEACLPGVRELVTESVFVSPEDLTRRTGAVNAGHHVSATLGQLLAGRPVRGCANYRTGIDGFYLTGAGTNPGSSISGLPGRACAEALLDDLADGWQARARRPMRVARRELGRLRRMSAAALDTRRALGPKLE